ncbi:hypothetical protein AL036_20515 [Salipiger aestuarii]|uniref:hypothetical protein n=1 Tax=Salipiger aestuarii TaxID=568098 RepID=UPI00123C494E|nr:hypothetical protein [Salipiger aestuarii]KAA8605141.1 hypothetical protein AL036_20515 [Salipiger aestuarii]
MPNEHNDTLRDLLRELAMHLNGSKDRFTDLGKVMPNIYFRAAIDVLKPAEMELQDIALRLTAELNRRGLLTPDPETGTGDGH